MHALNRRGFTLIELLIALVIGAVVGTATVKVLVGMQRTTAAGMQRVALHQNLRAGIGYITSIVRELDAGENDISVATATQLRFRGPRWASPLCADPVAGAGTSVTFLIDESAIYGIRTPDEAEDSVLIYADGDPNTRRDDAWLVGVLTKKVRTGTCPSSGAAATTLTVEVTTASGGQLVALRDVASGAPLRGFQIEQLSLFQGAGARWWLGQETLSGTVTPTRPLVGPLAARGLTFAYYDSTGAVTGTLADIASIEVALRAETSQRVRTAAGNIDFARDSIITRVALRNNPRF